MLINSREESVFPLPEGADAISRFIKEVPNLPGVYRFIDGSKKYLYIGKAKSLDKRLASYFRESSRTKKINKLIEEAQYIELSLTNTELESLLYEQFLIKKHKPKFNVQFKDDKGYPWIKIKGNDKFPSAISYLGKKENNGKYFGPFPSPYAVRDALKLVQKTFKLRNCSDTYFKNRTRPCLQHEIGRCSAPCTGQISYEEYQDEVKGAELLLSGKSEELIKEFYSLMDSFSSNREFERAAVYRDRISALREIQRSQSISGFRENRDAIFLSTKTNKPKIGVSSVNQGWVIGHKNYTLEDNFEDDSILERFISHNYFSHEECPSFLVVNQKIKNKSLLEKNLSEFHSKKISIISKPSKKDRGLLEICKTNTEFIQRKNRKDFDIDFKLEALKKELRIVHDIQTIESYDISHHSGDNAVAGCVVYSNEGKVKDLYRAYNISSKNQGNDIGSMIELVERRFSSNTKTPSPSLIIIDGGRTHLNTVSKKLHDLGMNKTKVISISKGVRRRSSFDSIHLESGESMIVKEGSIFHRFVQEIRDETHRYAISLQKRKRSRSSLSSSIDGLSGIGGKRKQLLLRYFGSYEQIRRASVEDLSEVSGIGIATATSIYRQLHKSY